MKIDNLWLYYYWKLNKYYFNELLLNLSIVYEQFKRN